MANNSERFRNEFASRVIDLLPPDKVNDILKELDTVMYGYEVSNKPVELITTDPIPEIVKKFIASKAIAGCSFKTVNQYRYKLINFFRVVNKAYSDIRPDDIRMYLNYYKEKYNASNNYRNNIRTTLHGFFQWLVDNEYLIRNPCAIVERIKFNPRHRDPYTPYQLETIRWDATKIDIRARALIDFLFSTGMRIDECAHVKLSDIDWQYRSVVIRHGKGDKERIVYFNAESELTLRKYLETRTDDSDGLFVSRKKPYHQVGEHALQNICKKVGAMTNIHVIPHRFRNSFATTSIDSGMALETLQALMGHSNPETTMGYVKRNQVRIRQEHQRVYA